MRTFLATMLVGFYASPAFCDYTRSDWQVTLPAYSSWQPQISDDSQKLLVVYPKNEIQILDINRQNELFRAPIKFWTEPQFSPSGSKLIVATSAVTLGLVDTSTGKVTKIDYDVNGYYGIWSYQFSSDERYVVARNANPGNDNAELAVVDLKSLTVVGRQKARFASYDIGPCGSAYDECVITTEIEEVSSMLDRTSIVKRKFPTLEVVEKKELFTANPGYTAWVYDISKNKKYAVLTERNVQTNLVIRDLATMEKIFSFYLGAVHDRRGGFHGKFSHDQRSYLVSDSVHFIQVLDIATGKEKFKLDLSGEDNDIIRNIWFGNDDKTLTYSTDDGRIAQVDLATKIVTPLFSIGESPAKLFSVGDNKFVSVSFKGKVSTWTKNRE